MTTDTTQEMEPMTTQTEQTATPGPPAATTPDPPDADIPPAGTGRDTPGPNHEAATYRRRLRDTEADRDRLAQQVQAMQKAEVERLASRLAQPSALWATTELADLLDDTGQVDPDKVANAIEQARTTLGLAVVSGTPSPANEGRIVDPYTASSWSRAFAPRH
ncbi:MAG: gp58-like family protein [Micrococcales bacterium]|nr:gp58-like family protein [Micrococcales bacterium]